MKAYIDERPAPEGQHLWRRLRARVTARTLRPICISSSFTGDAHFKQASLRRSSSIDHVNILTMRFDELKLLSHWPYS
jgi:hypothetical protein